MDLIPEKGVEPSEEEKAYKKMAKKFWLSVALSIPVFIIAMSDFFSFLHLQDLASQKGLGVGRIRPRLPRCFLCRLDFFQTQLEFHTQALAQHVDLNFHWRWCRLSVQCCWAPGTWIIPATV